MAHSDTAHLGGWRAFLVQTGLLLVGSFSVVILFSFGGQLVVAPALLPAQWIIARDTYGWVSKTFSVLGALLLAEVTYLIFALVFGEVPVTVVIGVPVALAAGFGFYRTSHRANQGR
jgi:hypothetical protein